jgi:hypothetical protein
MQVRITNVTDGPGKKPVEVRVYTKRLRPGSFMDVPVQFVDDKVRKLEQAGVIVIGPLPPWYSDYSARRKVKNLTASEVAANVQLKKDAASRKAAAQEAKEGSPAPSEVSSETVVIDPADVVKDIETWDVTEGTRDIRGAKNRPKR